MRAPRVTVEQLRLVPYFADLDDVALGDLARQVRTQSYEPGETILIEGWACDGLSFVIQGHVRVFRSGPDGREQVLQVVGPGRTFNDAAAFDQGPNPDGAAALGPATVGLIPAASLRTLLDRHAVVAKAAIQVLASRQRALGRVVEDLALRDVTARVAGLLLGCVAQHEHMVEGAPEACTRITHEEIAAMIGSVREVVQRSLKELERAGAIKLERTRIQILNPDALVYFAETNGS